VRLGDSFPILYSGQNGRVAHECILDLREITKETGVSVDDVAKRLMDFGFHAPTMSFPVAGTLMVEPTESENKEELDRFVDAMLAIATEIECVRRGEIGIDASPLRHAPHTVADLCGPWERQYTREQAVAVGSMSKSYFPPVRRIDSAHGDRNLICTCEPIDSFVNRGEAQMAVAQNSR
jgi:glycine dehydrogenase